jgi:general secretion pathway protein K
LHRVRSKSWKARKERPVPDPGNPKERGAALLTVLLLVAVMAVVASTALERVALATRMTGNGGAVDQARAFADAGTEMARLRINDLVESNPAKITLAGGWMGTPQTIPVPGGLATAQVTDGGNCFNLNSVVSGRSEALLKVRPVGVSQFQALLEALGVDARQAATAASSLADWVDSDTVPQPGGAEDETYAGMERPYRAANRMMIDPSELRAVAGNFLFSTGANEFAGRYTAGHFDLPMMHTTIALDGVPVVEDGRLVD